MTQAFVIPTGFENAADFVQGFKSHVDEDNVVLPTAEAVEEGDWVQFHICLADENPIFEGLGQCVAVFDNGEERPPEQRFDLVLAGVELQGASRVLFEQMIEQRLQGDPPVEVEEAISVDREEEVVALDDALDVEVHSDQPPEPAGYLSRPPVGGSWAPEPLKEQPPAPPPSGLFSYASGLDFPDQAPRPDPGTFREVSPAPGAAQQAVASKKSTAQNEPDTTDRDADDVQDDFVERLSEDESFEEQQ